jgi:hypothetical protein
MCDSLQVFNSPIIATQSKYNFYLRRIEKLLIEVFYSAATQHNCGQEEINPQRDALDSRLLMQTALAEQTIF